MEGLNIERVCDEWLCREERLLPCPGSSTASPAPDATRFFSKQIDHCLGRKGLFLLSYPSNGQKVQMHSGKEGHFSLLTNSCLI